VVRRDNIAGQYVLVAPLVVATVAVVVIALALTFMLSLQEKDPQRLFTSFTLSAYRESVINPLYGRILLRTVMISGIITAVTVAAAYPVAYFIAFHIRRHKQALLLLITAPFLTSYLLRVFAWKIILGYNGVINASLTSLGVIDAPLQFLVYNPAAIVIALSHAYVAFAVLPIYVALERIDRDLLEAASDLGARPFARFLQVTLPLSLPGVLAAALLIFVPTIGDYVTPTLVGGPDGLMVGNLIQAQFGKSNDWPAGSALAVATIANVGLLLLALWAAGGLHRRLKA
jgi:spermidine/putrescine transport system permease protein